MNDIVIDQGATEDFLIEDTEAFKAVLLVSLDVETAPIIEKEALFNEGKAQITLLKSDTNIAPDDYIYQIRLFDEDGEYFNLVNDNCSTGDCTFSTLKICPVIVESEG